MGWLPRETLEQRLDALDPGLLTVRAEHLPGAQRRRILDPIGEEDAVEVVELVLHRPRTETAEALALLSSRRVDIRDLDLRRAGEEAAEVGDAEAALVALVRLVAERVD